MGRRGILLATAAALVLGFALARGTNTRATPDTPASSDMFAIGVTRASREFSPPLHGDAPLQAVHDPGFRAARSDAFWMWAGPAPPHDGVHTYDWAKLDAEA